VKRKQIIIKLSAVLGNKVKVYWSHVYQIYKNW